MLDIVRNKIKGTDIESRIELHKCAEDKIGVTEKVDLVLAFFMVHEVADKRKMLEEVKSLLKPDGTSLYIEFKMHPPKRTFKPWLKWPGMSGSSKRRRRGPS